eukprot:1160573-Pelagomonas_calceolata.AAC.3
MITLVERPYDHLSRLQREARQAEEQDWSNFSLLVYASPSPAPQAHACHAAPAGPPAAAECS